MTDDARPRLVADAAARAARYLAAAGDRPVAPGSEAVAALDAFDTPLPDGPTPPEVVLAMLDDVGSPATVVNTNGRYFGFVTGGTDPAALAAGVLAGAWDQNTAVPVMSPTAVRLDSVAARWVVELLGLPGGSIATFCGGASVANLTGVLAGRDALLAREGWDLDADGMQGAPPLRVVTGAEAHVSATRALRLAGFGRSQTTLVPTDDCGRVVASDFPDVDARTLVVLQAGNVNTGHSDPFAELIPRLHAQGAWVHVDGAFGLWAAVSPVLRHLVAGVEQADSWATDGHKWLNAPYDSGIAICARPADLARAFTVDAAYVATDSDRSLMHLGVQMSQRARGVEAWAVLASQGRHGLTAIFERHCAQATRMAEHLAAGGAEVLAAVVLNQVLVAFGDDDRTAAVIDGVQRDGTCWAGGTVWHGRRAMRISVSDLATTDADIDASAAAIVRVAATTA